jgi:hypothetical protein
LGFERRRFSDSIREIQLPSDQEIYEKCKTCPIKDICGGHKEFLLDDDSRYCNRECWNCRAVCCKLDNIYERLDEFNGVRFDDVNYDFWEEDWPDFIWVIDEKIDFIDEDWYAIPFNHIYDHDNDSFNTKDDQKIRYEIPKNSKLTVSFCVKDKYLSPFKSREQISNLAKRFERYNFDFMLPVNFSIYKNFPRVDQLLNMKRSLLSMKEFFDSGINSIPNISLIANRDIERWIKWANKNRLNTCFFNLQTMKTYKRKVLEERIEKYEEFDRHLDWGCHYFIAGANVDDIKFIRDKLENVTFINNSAWRKSTFFQSVYDDNLKKKDMSKYDIFKANKKVLKSVYNNRENSLPDKIKSNFTIRNE